MTEIIILPSRVKLFHLIDRSSSDQYSGMASFSYVRSQRGNLMLQNEGFMYYREKCENDITFWKCLKYKAVSGRCLGRATTHDGKVELKHDHNHAGDAAAIEVREVHCTLRKRGVDTRDAPKFILAESISSCSQAALSQLPPSINLKRTVRTSRRKVGPRFKDPVLREDITLHATYTQTKRGEPFLLYNSGKVADRIIIFGTLSQLEVLARTPHWFIDGTFKHCPRTFQQILTIHGLRNDRCLPFIFALLPNKAESTYNALFDVLHDLKQLNPQSVMSDYEKGLRNAVQCKFPNATIRGCLFHFNQCIYRAIQNDGLKKRYDSDADFALNIRHLSALAFVPPADVTATFEFLENTNHFLPEAQPVVEYFEDVWVGRPRRTLRKPPQYDHASWNCYNATLEGLPRTNNAVEGWHRGFDALTTRYHDSLWETIENFKREQALTELTLEQDGAGGPPQEKRRCTMDAESHLASVVLTYEDVNDDDGLRVYLRGVTSNLSY